MYDDYETTADLNEIIYYEKLDADMEMAQLEAEGNRHAKRMRKVEAALAIGDRTSAVEICDHGHVGKLDGACSEDDPRYMEEGYRCYNCDAVVDEIMGNVLKEQ